MAAGGYRTAHFGKWHNLQVGGSWGYAALMYVLRG
jgi:arylsulfatase A-like enzyme